MPTAKILVATYNRDHVAVQKEDGTIEIFRRPSATQDHSAIETSRAAFERINRRNQEFWKQREGVQQ